MVHSARLKDCLVLSEGHKQGQEKILGICYKAGLDNSSIPD